MEHSEPGLTPAASFSAWAPQQPAAAAVAPAAADAEMEEEPPQNVFAGVPAPSAYPVADPDGVPGLRERGRSMLVSGRRFPSQSLSRSLSRSRSRSTSRTPGPRAPRAHASPMSPEPQPAVPEAEPALTPHVSPRQVLLEQSRAAAAGIAAAALPPSAATTASAARDADASTEGARAESSAAAAAAARNGSTATSALPQPSSTKPSLPTLSADALGLGYYCTPPLHALAALDAASLRAVQGFVVGCTGAGEVRFLEPVDLSDGPPLERVVQLAPGARCVALYAHSDGPPLPRRGAGLNVPFEATLLRVFPCAGCDEAARERFIGRMRRSRDARFVSYDAAEGTWRFIGEPAAG